MTTPKVSRQEERRKPLNQMAQPQELHCSGCGRFLCYQAIILGTVRIKCPNCKEWTAIDISPDYQ